MADFNKLAKASKASQGTKELTWLLEKVANINPKVVLEIGVHQGYSLQVWQDAFEPKLLVGVDNERNEVLDANLADGLNKAKFIYDNSHTQAALDQVKAVLDDNKVDFLFIDGDHMAEGVKQDFEMYGQLVRKGGIIAFDDMDLFDNEHVEVYKFWKEVKKNYKSDSIHADSNGIGILYV